METKVTSETGGTKGQKLARFDLIPVGPLKAVAEQFGRGAAKYEERNWERGYPWSLSYAAAMRHLTAFWNGEDWDQDSEMEGHAHHLDAAMFHIMALREFFEKHPGYDDRPNSETFRQAEANRRTTLSATEAEYTKVLRRERPVQTRRWEIP